MGRTRPRWPPSFRARTYAFDSGDANEHKIETARWDFDEDGATVTVRDGLGEHQIEAGADAWRRGTTTLREGHPHPAAARDAWTAEDTYVLTAYFYETPFALTLIARFAEGGAVQFDLRQNVSFDPTERPPLEGRPV